MNPLPTVPFQVMRIDAIPTKSLETIKDWLTSVRIKYYESKLNLAWKPILKSIQVRWSRHVLARSPLHCSYL